MEVCPDSITSSLVLCGVEPLFPQLESLLLLHAVPCGTTTTEQMKILILLFLEASKWPSDITLEAWHSVLSS